MFILYGKYQNTQWEEIDSADTKKEMEHLLNEYTIAFGIGWIFKIKKG